MKKVRTADFDPNAPPTLESPLDGMPLIGGPSPAARAVQVTSADASRVESPNAIGQSTDQSTSQPTERPAEQPTVMPTDQPSGRIVNRPKSFYITKRLDRRIDDAVHYFKRKNINRVDRSTVLNAILDRDEHFTEASLSQLVDRVVSQLASRLTD